MLAPVSKGRKDGHSSFYALQKYLLTEIDAETGERKFRGDYILSENLLSLETAPLEMYGVAVNNTRVKDPVFHFQITWQAGEIPTREQWEHSVKRSLEALGFDAHQFVAACHNNTDNFHVHVMVNRVHPETYRAHMPKFYHRELDKTMRQQEHNQGWREDPGLYRWDASVGMPVQNSSQEMAAIRAKNSRAAQGVAGKVEHYNDIESFQTYARHNAAKELHTLLQRPGVRWTDVHQLLAAKGLMLEKGEKGGYTVRAVNQEIRAKASDVFRQDFAGKTSRAKTESILGVWEAPEVNQTTPEHEYTRAEKEPRKTLRDPAKRLQAKEQRQDEREALKKEFFAYRNERRAAQKAYTATVRERRKSLNDNLKQRKLAIRAGRSASWQERRAAISMAIAETVIEQRLLAVRAHKERLGIGPTTYQQWVQQKALAGDKRAISQMRGWRYQDQRNVRRIEREIEDGSRTTIMLMSEDLSDVAAWEKLSNDEVRELEHAESVANVITSMRMAVHKSTGHVTYMLKGHAAFVDKGKAISVVTTDEAATVLALEMAVKKYGPRITIQGSQKWRENVARIAARNNVFIEFTDPTIQRVMQQEREKIQAHRAKKDWTLEKSGLDGLPKPLRDQAEKEYQRWARANEKNASAVSFADYVAFRQGPRARAYRAFADQVTQIRATVLRTQGKVLLRTDADAKLFMEGLYGARGAAFLAVKIEATKAASGKPVETNLHNLATLTTTLQKNGRIEYLVRPADPAQARKQAEELAGILQQSASEATRLAATPPIRVHTTAGKSRHRDMGR